MTLLTKSAIAVAILAVMAGTAFAQSGPSRQIQVLAAPGEQQTAQAQATQQPATETETDGAAAQPEQAQPEPQAEQATPQEAKPAPKFIPAQPKFVAPKRPAYAEGYGHERYGYAGSYGYAPKRYRNHCH
jgi:hypothetical protein